MASNEWHTYPIAKSVDYLRSSHLKEKMTHRFRVNYAKEPSLLSVKAKAIPGWGYLYKALHAAIDPKALRASIAAAATLTQ